MTLSTPGDSVIYTYTSISFVLGTDFFSFGDGLRHMKYSLYGRWTSWSVWLHISSQEGFGRDTGSGLISQDISLVCWVGKSCLAILTRRMGNDFFLVEDESYLLFRFLAWDHGLHKVSHTVPNLEDAPPFLIFISFGLGQRLTFRDSG